MSRDADEGRFEPRIDVTLGGKTYDLKPTFGALVRIEQTLDAGLGVLLLRFLRREHGVADTTRIVYEGIVAAAGNDAPEYEEIGALVMREGIEAVAPAALDMLTAALRGLEKFTADKVEETEQAAASEDERPTPPQGVGSPGADSSAPPS